MTPTDPVRFPRPKPPSRESLLSMWIQSYAEQNNTAAERIRRVLGFELVLAAFERAADGEPWIVVKGGHAMEMRIPLRARATKDMDGMLRAAADPDEIERAVKAALQAPLHDGDVDFELRFADEIGTTGVNGRRFLPAGGHRCPPVVAVLSPRWWPWVLPGARYRCGARLRP